jgi:bifunctional non-homologous end joining protein LigD
MAHDRSGGTSNLPRVAPMMAVLGAMEDLRDDAGWGFEMKWDGVRAVVYLESGRVSLISRNDIDMSVSYPEISASEGILPGRAAILDSEIVSFDVAGRPSFRRLQKRMHVSDAGAARRLARSEPVVMLLFDVMYLDGESLLRQPYSRRREILESLRLSGASWQTPPAFDGRGADAVTFSKQQGLEGVIAKRLDSIYIPGRRSPNWVKIKNVRAQEVVIGGWTPGNGRRAGLIGALLLGVPRSEGRLDYVGKVGTGFTDAMLRDLDGDFEPLAAGDSPFVTVPRPDARDARWLLPTLVGEVAYTEWTDDGRLRHPAWRGLRPDKAPDQVVREI